MKIKTHTHPHKIGEKINRESECAGNDEVNNDGVSAVAPLPPYAGFIVIANDFQMALMSFLLLLYSP